MNEEIIRYYINGSSMSKISKILDMPRASVKKVLNLNGIKIRTASETSSIQFANYTKASPPLLSRIDGWLLGDGSMEGIGQACFKIPSKHKEYIDYIKLFFDAENIYCNQYATFDKNTKKYYHRLTTCSTLQFKEMKSLWYPDNKKRTPKNLKLTNESIKNWIMDDGTRNKKDGSLTFCTHGFNYDDCLFLETQLNRFIEMECAKINRDGKYYKIRIGRVGANNLLNKIGDCEIDCFEYKWFKKI